MSHTSRAPLYSVVVINYNAKAYLKGCLEAILKNDYPNFEIIVVDNASADGSLASIDTLLKRSRNKIRIVANKKNLGPAIAANQGIKLARGRLIAVLASDTKPLKTWLSNMAEVMLSDPTIGAAQAKLKLMEKPDFLDSTGDLLTKYGFLVKGRGSFARDPGDLKTGTYILGGKGAGLTYNSGALLKVGYHDPDFFMFLEETDLNWRLWLAGYKVIFINEAIIYHVASHSSRILPNKFHRMVRFYGCRNYILTLIKNLSWKWLFLILPIHLALWVGMAFFLLLKRKLLAAWDIVRAIISVILDPMSVLRKRKAVQSLRKVSDESIFNKIMKRMPLRYFIYRFTTPAQFGGTENSWMK